ncbi:hypothetical protein TNCV_4492541 [Trichonephila clavipes]|nr:hypothetical protein TNCV_4492541 [Trichonephila clavipes]
MDPHPDAVALYSGCTSDSPLTVTPHRTLNSCRGVISESDLLCTSETEILEGLSDQGVTQPLRLLQPEMLNKFQKLEQEKELLKKMNEAIIEIKMRNKPRKPASDEYTTDEEKMIVYDVEDEIEPNLD